MLTTLFFTENMENSASVHRAEDHRELSQPSVRIDHPYFHNEKSIPLSWHPQRAQALQSKLQVRPASQHTAEYVVPEINRYMAQAGKLLQDRDTMVQAAELDLLFDIGHDSNPMQHVHCPGNQGFLQPIKARQRA